MTAVATALKTDRAALPKFDFDYLRTLAQDAPDRYLDMRSLLIISMIRRLVGTSSGLPELQQKIDLLPGIDSSPDRRMLEIARLLSERVSALAALTRILQSELVGKAESTGPSPTKSISSPQERHSAQRPGTGRPPVVELFGRERFADVPALGEIRAQHA